MEGVPGVTSSPCPPCHGQEPRYPSRISCNGGQWRRIIDAGNSWSDTGKTTSEQVRKYHVLHMAMPRIIPSITQHIIVRRLGLYNRMLCLPLLAHIWYQTQGHTRRLLLGVIPSIRPHITPSIIVSHRISDPVSHRVSVYHKKY